MIPGKYGLKSKVLFQTEKCVVAVNPTVIIVETRHAQCTDLNEIGRKKKVS
jgi:hypothetical protein